MFLNVNVKVKHARGCLDSSWRAHSRNKGMMAERHIQTAPSAMKAAFGRTSASVKSKGK